MKRHYVSVLERRMPWSLFPVPEQLSFEQRVRILTTYRQIQNICKYQEAKTSLTFAEWNGIYSIPLSSTKLTDYKNVIRQSRSGRLLKNKPQYVDDGSDSDASYTKKKTKKARKSSTDNFSSHHGLDKNTENSSPNKYENVMINRTNNEIIYSKTNLENSLLKTLSDVSDISNNSPISNQNDLGNKKIQNSTEMAATRNRSKRSKKILNSLESHK